LVVQALRANYPDGVAPQSAAIGVDIGGTSTKAAIVDRDGKMLARVHHPTDPSAGTKTVIAVVDELLTRAGEVGASIEAIGVGAAGFIDAPSGSVTFAPNLSYDDPHIALALYGRTELPVIVDNDANAAAWGERVFGNAGGADDMVLLMLGTGIGSGIVANGRLVRGHTGAGAEFGHVVIDPEGPHCKCGLRGCLEQFASGRAIARMAREAVRRDPSSSILDFAGSIDDITGEHVGKAARERDEAARDVLRRAGGYLGIGLSNIANLFDPAVIVLGGGLVAAGEPYLGAARDRMFAMTTAQRRRPMRLDVTTLGNAVGIIGAAALAFDEAFEPDARPRIGREGR
jgi:glucokinase